MFMRITKEAEIDVCVHSDGGKGVIFTVADENDEWVIGGITNDGVVYLSTYEIESAGLFHE